ncbi:MAG TPA: carboxypeptidase regulatory-like domain-containing protein, partial [Thermoplasmatales archaeon]|nr:carboxypeptidase regulatory-like domain-containing protein [Thermoplasmatales archaeon]
MKKQVLFLIVLFLVITPNVLVFKTTSTTCNLRFKQELKVPVDTSRVETWFQPVDVHVEFNHRCWARNETCHSVRVCYDDGSGLVELESQVYDLEFIDENHVKACNLVFLIPENVDGKE